MTDNNELKDRIKELGDKSTQILTFLSFALVVVTTLAANVSDQVKKQALSCALRWWVFAVFPVLVGIAPLKEVAWGRPGWYRFVRGLKFILLWAALLLIFLGLWQFRRVVS